MENQGDRSAKPRRKCCGLPLWAFILLVLLLLCIIAAAIVIPLEYFVFKNLGNHSQPKTAIAQCQASLDCKNGGTNVLSQNVCSCICTNGFTGSDCSTGGSSGCTTTNLVATDGSSNIANVTLGHAIPRLIAEANTNFSIPLSGTAILSKFNAADLSCIAQNSLVTFDGEATRVGDASTKIKDNVSNAAVNAAAVVGLPVLTLTLDNPEPTSTGTPVYNAETTATSTFLLPRSTSTSTSTLEMAFMVTEQVLDFARVAVLYVLQEQGSSSAEKAQTELQTFFALANKVKTGDSATTKDAASLRIGGSNTINLVDLNINIGAGTVGAGQATQASKRTVSATGATGPHRRHFSRRDRTDLATP